MIGVRGNHHQGRFGDFVLTPALFPHLSDLALIGLLRGFRTLNGLANLRDRNFRKGFTDGSLNGFSFIEINKRCQKLRFRVRALKIELQSFRIASYHRTGKATRHIRKVRAFFWNAGQPNTFDAFFGQPGDVSVGKLSRQTKALRGNAFNTEPCDVVIRIGGELHMKSEFRKKLKPVGVMLIDIEHSRNAD
ncbi:unknown [Sutterella sp. CAG:521]|nr:unknown [Sutterella sp. CAG:521]